MRPGRWLVLLLATNAVEGSAADADLESRRTEARELAMRGDATFAAGRCDKAIPLWEQAEQRYHAPTLLLRVAHCEALLGRVVSAASRLESIAGEKLAPDAPAPWVEARASAVKELPAVRERIAALRVVAEEKAPGGEPRSELDDAPVQVSVDVPTDPGRHVVRVRATGTVWEQTVDLEDGEHREVRVAITLVPAVVTPPTQRRLGLVLGGAGIALAGVGGLAFGIPALGESAHLNSVCGPNRDQCPLAEQGTIGALQRNAILADLGMGLGGALTVAGAIVFLTSPAIRSEGPSFHIVPLGTGAALVGNL